MIGGIRLVRMVPRLEKLEEDFHLDEAQEYSRYTVYTAR